jgi:outer membrane autotransporter protein
MGLDVALGTQTMVGMAAAAGETSASLSGGLGRANAWSGQLGLFGRTRLATRAGGFTLEGAAAVSFLETDTKRTQYFLGNAEQRASYDARVYSFRLEGRHDGMRSGVTIQPLLALQAQVVDSDGYSERSPAAGTSTGVTARSATNSTVRTELGVQARAQWRWRAGRCAASPGWPGATT